MSCFRAFHFGTMCKVERLISRPHIFIERANKPCVWSQRLLSPLALGNKSERSCSLPNPLSTHVATVTLSYRRGSGALDARTRYDKLSFG